MSFANMTEDERLFALSPRDERWVPLLLDWLDVERLDVELPRAVFPRHTEASSASVVSNTCRRRSEDA